jgi:hypothetical protein
VAAPSTPPEKTPAALRIVQLQGAGRHTFALRSDGVVFGWGTNSYGVLSPDKSITNVAKPQRILGLPKARQVASGDWHACAVTETGEVWCWGRSYGGALGNGSMKDKSFLPPSRVDGVVNVADISADGGSEMGARSFFRLNDGSVSYVGVVPGSVTAKAAALKHFAPAKQVVTEGYTACAVKTSGKVVCQGLLVGSPMEIKLGYLDRPLPYLPAIDKMALGPTHACAVTAEGHAYCWGSEELAKLDVERYNRNDTALPAPRRVAGLANVVDIAIGGAQTCATTRDGQVVCWTRHDDPSRIGSREEFPAAKPEALKLDLDVTAVVLCGAERCFLDRGGRVFCMRGNPNPQPRTKDQALPERPTEVAFAE